METLGQDIRHALRLFRENPIFAITAVAALTLGIGVNVAIFSVVNAVLLKPVPFAEPDRLVTLMISSNRNPLIPFASPAQFMYWRTLTGIFEDVAAFTNISLNYTAGDTPERVTATRASEAYFRTLRAPIFYGRGFTTEEDRPGGANVAVVSHEFWDRRLGADPGVVGERFHSTVPLTPWWGSPARSWICASTAARRRGCRCRPIRTRPFIRTSIKWLRRLERGVTVPQAQGRLEASVAAFRERFPGVLGPRAGFSALPMQSAVVGRGARTTLFFLCGAVACVLLIACANVANLLLVRASIGGARLRFAPALGASRGRVVRQLLAESVSAVARRRHARACCRVAGMRALLAVDTAGLPRLGEAGVARGPGLARHRVHGRAHVRHRRCCLVLLPRSPLRAWISSTSSRLG